MLKRHTPLVSDTSCQWSCLTELSQPLAETVLLWRKTWQLKRSFTFQVNIVAGKFSMNIIIIIGTHNNQQLKLMASRSFSNMSVKIDQHHVIILIYVCVNFRGNGINIRGEILL